MLQDVYRGTNLTHFKVHLNDAGEFRMMSYVQVTSERMLKAHRCSISCTMVTHFRYDKVCLKDAEEL